MGAPKKSMPRPTRAEREQIEQAVARGLRPSQIMRRYGYSYELVSAVRLAMDLACVDTLSRYSHAEIADERRIVATNRARADWAAQVSLSQAMRKVERPLQALIGTARSEAMSA